MVNFSWRGTGERVIPHGTLIKCPKLRTSLRERPYTSTHNMNPFFVDSNSILYILYENNTKKDRSFTKILMINDSNNNSNDNNYIWQ